MTKEKIIEIMENELECVHTASDNKCDRDCENCKLVRDSDDIIKAYDFVIEMLEQEPCEDVISRQEAIDAICKACSMDDDYHKCDGYPKTSTWCDELVALRALPSVTPQPKTGHWEEYGHNISDSYIWDGVRCSVCKKDARVKNRFIKREPVVWDRDCFELTNYCPNCGAKMIEPQESEE